MSSSVETWKGQGPCVEDIEQQMSELLNVHKEKIEQSLREKINQEKEVAQKKIEEMEQEYEAEKKLLEEYKFNLTDLQTSKEKVVEQIREHFNRTMKCQDQIKITLEEANEELQKINELSEELEGIRKRVEEENSRLSKALEERFGIEARLPQAFEFVDVPAEWNQEVGRMEKLRELLTSIENSEVVKQVAVGPGDNGGNSGSGGSVDVPKEEALSAPESPEAGVPATMPEALAEELTEELTEEMKDELMEEYLVDESDSTETAEEKEPAADEETVEAASDLPESLARYRKTEPIANGNEFGYFENGSARILDGESFIRSMVRISEEARKLHTQLEGKESVKDVFMLKQEILNEQEILRKLFFRALTFCEKEDGSLPYYLSDVINPESLKDVLELLTIGNWSDPSEFKVFQNNVTSLKDSYEDSIESLEDYVTSLRDQIESDS